MTLSYKSLSGSSASSIAQTFTAASNLYRYKSTVDLAVGTYTVSCVNSTNATIEFYNGSTLITSATTSSGTVVVNLATAATNIAYFVNTGSDVIISLQLTGIALTTASSGTVDIITTTSTYNQTGLVYYCVVGGGGGGGNGSAQQGGGGASGGIASGRVTLNTSTSIEIGAAGNGGTGNTNQISASGTVFGGSGNAGGSTVFGNIVTVNGGNGGSGGSSNNWNGTRSAAGGTGGTPGGGRGAGFASVNSTYNALASDASTYSFVVSGTTGGGAGGDQNSYAGSGIGTGGARGNENGSAGSGYGSGGGGGQNGTGGNGAPGVVYIIRGL